MKMSENKTMRDIEDILEFDSLIIFSGIGGREITDADIQKAMDVARRLKEKEIFEFDFTDKIAFLKSVARFADPRRKI